MKHTPGPWLYRAKSDSVHLPPENEPYQFGVRIFRFDEDESPNDADLALILAAPDLLAALEECVEDSEEAVTDYVLTYGENFRPKRLEAMRETVKKARAAIAKATGSEA